MVATPAPGNACTKYGVALPTVSAPTMVPTASPRRALNHVAIIFIAGGYTPARQNPHAKRVTIAAPKPCASRSAVVLAAPSTAATAKKARDGTEAAGVRAATASG